VEQQFICVEGLDLQAVHTVGGDFDRDELAHTLTGDRILDQMVAGTVRVCGNEPTLIFTCPREKGAVVSQGEMFANALNKLKPESAVFLSGEHPEEYRDREIGFFEQGQRQYLVGCSLFTEGFNVPKISRVVMARLTKSHVYYTQAIGRGTRTLRGVLRPEHQTAEERQAAIAASAKPRVVVIDFVGNSGRHKLISAIDIFAGKSADAVVARAKKKAEEQSRPIREILQEAQEEEAQEEYEKARQERDRRLKPKSRVAIRDIKIVSRDVSPYSMSDSPGQRQRSEKGGRATTEQIDWIRKHGGFADDIVTAGEAGAAIADIKRRWSKGLCSPKQERILKRNGLTTTTERKEIAKALIDWLVAKNWLPRQRPSRKQLAILPGGNGDGVQLTIDGIRVGGVYPSVQQLREVYQCLPAESQQTTAAAS
jgi:superfamily II DNA/RNA helicase